jgi:hypothetical protein
VIVLGLLAVIASACGSQPASPPPASPSASTAVVSTPAPTPTTTPTATPAPTPKPTPTPEPTPLKVPSPLTGLPVTPEVAQRHPIAVMLDDLRVARPQSGISEASIVWHAPAEGGIPRYMAIFSDHLPKEIGPVRSARVYYLSWAAEYDAVYAHSGGSPAALALLKSQGDGSLVYDANEFYHGNGAFNRVTFRSAPHNVYTSGARMHRLGIRLGAKDGAYESPWQFAPDGPPDQRPYGGTITVVYPRNTITYRYDRATNTWPRAVTGEKAQTDAGNGERIAPKNVVVMFAQFTQTGDRKHRLDADIIGSGKASIVINGRSIDGTWKKTAVKAPTQFFDASGEPVTFSAGQTFIQVVDIGTPVTIKPGSDTPPAASPTPSG